MFPIRTTMKVKTMNTGQRNVLMLVDDMSVEITDRDNARGMPLYKGEGRIVYALAAYDTLECWQMLDDEVKQLDSIVPPDTYPALYSKLNHWAHSL